MAIICPAASGGRAGDDQQERRDRMWSGQLDPEGKGDNTLQLFIKQPNVSKVNIKVQNSKEKNKTERVQSKVTDLGETGGRWANHSFQKCNTVQLLD